VDLAANDATLLSNAYALEKYYGWKGLCLEPNPDYFHNLSHYQENCDLVAAVVGRARMEQVYFYEAGDHSGILGFNNPERFKERSKQEYTITSLINLVYQKSSTTCCWTWRVLRISYYMSFHRKSTKYD
jgi:hypothetical protein